MASKLKKSGQKLAKKISRFSHRAGTSGKEHVRENLIERLSHIRDVRLLIVEWSLIVLVVIILASVQASWYSGSYSVSSFKNGGTYIEGTLGKVNSLNPLFASTNSEKTISRLLFTSLTEDDYSGHVGVGLAQTIRYDETAEKWTVKLRDGLKWSDGEPITNEDVLFTVNLIQNPEVVSKYSTALSGVKASETESGEILFDLPAPYVYFNAALNFPILPKHSLENSDPKLLLESDFSKNPVSSGAFKFNATQPVGTNGEVIIYLNANENYYKGKPQLSNFAVHAFLDNNAILSALNSETITATAELSGKDSKRVTSKNILELKASINSGVYAFLNTKSENLSNVAVRQAIQKGIDLGKLREVANSTMNLDYPILHSQADLINWQAIPERNDGFAKVALKEAGINETKVLTIVTINEANLPDVAENLAEQLRELGFSANVTAYDYSQEFISNVINARNYDIFLYDVELGVAPELFSYYHSSQTGSSGLNFSNYSNTIINDIILAVRETTDESLRNAKYESFIKTWINDVPAIAIYQPTISYYYNKNVRTFSENINLVTSLDRFVEIETWATEKTSLNRTP